MGEIVADTSIITNGGMLSLAESGKLRGATITIPEAAVDELQSQASQGRQEGMAGLEQIRLLQKAAPERGIQVGFAGQRPSAEDIGLSGRGRIDAIIKDVARQRGAELYTSDRLQHSVALAQGMASVLYSPERASGAEFERYFDEKTMSVHLKEGMRPLAKRGGPGDFNLVEAGSEALSRQYLQGIMDAVLDSPETRESGSEFSEPGATVVQHGRYRIAATCPPLSPKYEVTIVRPIASPSIEEYGLSDKLLARVLEGAEGIIISGPPGSGKSTLASALANRYASQGSIVKTFESPRDLQVGPGVTQYSKLGGSFANTAEILLLVRPDYTIFDEVRRREDFVTFSDLRLTGVGMVGVVHASSPLDSVQRFVGKIELGIIPHVIDTVIFVSGGRVERSYELELKVKVPYGMAEQDLARPVVEVRDFETGKPQYEIYTFGDENVIMPVADGQDGPTGIERLARERLEEIMRRYDPRAQVRIIPPAAAQVSVSKSSIARIIGRAGSNISSLERELGLKIDIVERKGPEGQRQEGGGEGLPFSFGRARNSIVLRVGREYAGMHAGVYAGQSLLLEARIGQSGSIKVPRRAGAARQIEDAGAGGIQVMLAER